MKGSAQNAFCFIGELSPGMHDPSFRPTRSLILIFPCLSCSSICPALPALIPSLTIPVYSRSLTVHSLSNPLLKHFPRLPVCQAWFWAMVETEMSQTRAWPWRSPGQTGV
jgi:hypothetical protein